MPKLQGSREMGPRARWARGRAAALIALLAIVPWPGAAFGAADGSSATVPLHTTHVDWELHGGAVEHQHVAVTIVQPESRDRTPWLLVLHGRPVDRSRLSLPGRHEYPRIAERFARIGYTVVIPTRVGYGVSGGPDIEFSGDCGAKDHGPSMAAAREEIAQVLEHVRALPGVEPDAGLAVGESFGGLIALYLASHPLAGLRGVVNFAGGDGGLPNSWQQPCGADEIERSLRDWSGPGTLPSLWVYGAADRFWGERWPVEWSGAFAARGAKVEFLRVEVTQGHGHEVFTRAPQAWEARFARFARGLGVQAHRREGSGPGRNQG